VRLEPLQRLCEPPIPFRLRCTDQIRRAVRVGLANPRNRRVEVAEDPPDLFLEEAEALRPESLDLVPHPIRQPIRGATVRGLEVRPKIREDRRDDGGLGIVDGPDRVVRGRDREAVERFPLLIGGERRPEREDEEDVFRGLEDLRSRRDSEPGRGDRARDPRRVDGLDADRVPPPASRRGREQPFEEVAARGHDLRAELADVRGIERECELRPDLELSLDRLWSSHPQERLRLGDLCAQIGERLPNELL